MRYTNRLFQSLLLQIKWIKTHSFFLNSQERNDTSTHFFFLFSFCEIRNWGPKDSVLTCKSSNHVCLSLIILFNVFDVCHRLFFNSYFIFFHLSSGSSRSKKSTENSQPSDEASKRFSGAKSISSAQFFGNESLDVSSNVSNKEFPIYVFGFKTI